MQPRIQSGDIAVSRIIIFRLMRRQIAINIFRAAYTYSCQIHGVLSNKHSSFRVESRAKVTTVRKNNKVRSRYIRDLHSPYIRFAITVL